MENLEDKAIGTSKVKTLLLFLISVGFVVCGIWMLTLDVEVIENKQLMNSPMLVYGAGILSIPFFGLGGIVFFKKLFDASPGLVITKDGITDNSSGVSAGFIPWSEVVEIGQYNISFNKFISIVVENPDKYVNKGNFFQRTANQVNLKMSGTPINITSTALKIGFDELRSTIEKYFENYRRNI